MKCLVGLGNPGKQYAQTRHNIGFMVLKPLYMFAPEKKFKAMVARPNRETLAILPQTYMNESGAAVAALIRFYKIKPVDVWVMHDDIDLPLGTIRIQRNRSSAGHRGVASIINALGTQDFWRFRIGIRGKTRGGIPTDDFVLQSFTAAESTPLAEVLKQTRSLLTNALSGEIKEYNFIIS